MRDHKKKPVLSWRERILARKKKMKAERSARTRALNVFTKEQEERDRRRDAYSNLDVAPEDDA